MLTQDDTRTPAADTTRPTRALVASTEVDGTEVYSPTGDHLGHIDHLMIDKVSGRVAYAVMAFGGFMGMGEEHHPIPWAKLRYDPTRGGFTSDVTREEVEGAPSRPRDWRDDRAWEESAFSHYGVTPYWI
ncbi:PRC-barrel domain containing protein [Mesobaculum littorinae]|uniref:PRC-barrel domain containing protein n=1 Tax=Mesobaculum littorinae TaxID=2486419 RepID=A0A438AKQ9_9RHOB|nr:PRC-barrel domain-containing protein [Mesobaculum littorinae]RVV99167.1 PRC-barrel domain containing protein [Mesobaculum littorinae]